MSVSDAKDFLKKHKGIKKDKIRYSKKDKLEFGFFALLGIAIITSWSIFIDLLGKGVEV